MLINPLRRIILCVMCLAPLAAGAAQPDVALFTVKGSFGAVKERVVIAIENRGLVLNYTAHIGAMLERTGKDVGRPTPVYGNAEMVEFCSALVSRDAMEADPHNIVYCPYAIAIYTRPKEPGTVYVAYRRPGLRGTPASVKAMRAVDALLDGIVREAIK
jgi:Domain of unknown function DUF302